MAQVGSYELHNCACHSNARPCLSPMPWEGLGTVIRPAKKSTKFSAREWRLTREEENLLLLSKSEAYMFKLLTKEYYRHEIA